MKILHVTPYIDPIYGGPSVAILSMANAMHSQGAEVHVVTTNAAGIYDLPLEDGLIRQENGVTIKFFRRFFPKMWFRSPSMNAWLQAHAKDYDILHLHVPFTAPFRYAAISALAAKKPYIATLHGLLDPWSIAQKSWKKKPYLRLFEKKILAQATALHVTAPIENIFIKEFSFGPPIYCLPLAVEQHLSNLYKSQTGTHILCIARLHPVKAIPILLKAFALIRKECKEIILDIAGDGDPSFVHQLRKKADELAISDAVIWHGHVDKKKKIKLFTEATCFALLSYHENFGLAAAEALAFGLPVVLSNQVGIAPDVMLYKAGEVVDIDDPFSAARAISCVIDSKLNHKYRKQALQLANDRYRINSFTTGLVSIYQSVLNK